MEKTDKNRMGVSIGSGVGSLQAMEREHKKLLEKGPGRISPMLVPMMITNMAAGNVAIDLGLKVFKHRNCMCNRNTFDRRSIQIHSVW